MIRVLIRGGRVIDPASGRDEVGDVWLIDGRVAEVPDGDRAVDLELNDRLSGTDRDPGHVAGAGLGRRRDDCQRDGSGGCRRRDQCRLFAGNSAGRRQPCGG
ncbi:MAG TPA: hypothetical protein EYQ27_20010 [Gemmatimonadetes bacterium]|nr:hypothetical protein [Gemmatimonadota bacterium]